MPHDENEPPVVQQITHKVEKLAIMRDDSQENQVPRPKAEKLMIFDDSQENQAPQQQPRASKPRRKKGMEVNETQISRFLRTKPCTVLAPKAHY